MFAGLSDRQWLWFAAGFYLASFLLGVSRRGRAGAWIYALAGFGYALQFVGLYLRGREDGGCPLGNLFEILQFTAWSAMTLYLVIGVTFRSSLLGYCTAGLGAALTLASLAVPDWDSSRNAHLFGGNPWIELHAALAIFSYGVFGLLALTSTLFLLRHYSLKSKRIGGWFSFLPSILDLDHIGVRLLTAGVALLFGSLVLGAVYWAHDTSLVTASKLLITVPVWVAYAAALTLRLRGRLLAKRFAWTCVLLFLVALISLAPVNASRHPEPERIAIQPA
ncbi:MAG TPA: cytochrome c biogenesis protein CcsA [Opitutaceae bacterium]|nr:cytochrome c biogenesis protein CcsA [Opitutaceae bacterium]